LEDRVVNFKYVLNMIIIPKSHIQRRVLGNIDPRQKRGKDEVHWERKHPLLTHNTRHVPLVEIKYIWDYLSSKLVYIDATVQQRYETNNSTYSPLTNCIANKIIIGTVQIAKC
jgi:hypothetical protein